MRNLFMMMIVLSVQATAAGQQDPTWKAVKSEKAQKAKLNYDREVKVAENAFRSKIRELRESLLSDLKEAQDDETRQSHLDEALAIRDQIERISKLPTPIINMTEEAESPKSTVQTVAAFEGTWTLTDSAGASRPYRITREGEVEVTFQQGHVWKGTLKLVNGEFRISYQGKYSGDVAERLTLHQERLFVEHWFRSPPYANTPPSRLGIGSRVSSDKVHIK